MSIASGKLVYYYMTRDSLCFLTLTEESYPKRLAFIYLEEVADVILQEFTQEFGNDVSGMLAFGWVMDNNDEDDVSRSTVYALFLWGDLCVSDLSLSLRDACPAKHITSHTHSGDAKWTRPPAPLPLFTTTP